MEDIRDSLT